MFNISFGSGATRPGSLLKSIGAAGSTTGAPTKKILVSLNELALMKRERLIRFMDSRQI